MTVQRGRAATGNDAMVRVGAERVLARRAHLLKLDEANLAQLDIGFIGV